jgi:competence protein ComGC
LKSMRKLFRSQAGFASVELAVRLMNIELLIVATPGALR